MAITYTWGDWEEQWPNGRFQCVFVESQPQSNGMICANGLYCAVDGDILYDVDTYQEAIRERAAVITDDSGKLLVKTEFAELLTLIPGFLQELTERFQDLSSEQTQSNRIRGRYDTPSLHGRCREQMKRHTCFE